MKILVTGAGGFLGSRLVQYYRTEHTLFPIGHKDCDITKEKEVKNCIIEIQPDIVIHCAAISDIAECEKDPVQSKKVNVDGTKYLIKACREYSNTKFIFCSSDQVYVGGENKELHVETEDVAPPHLYGQQKLEAECIIHDLDANAICLRLSWMYDKKKEEKQTHDHLISILAKQIWEKKKMMYSNQDFRSITYVWEVVGNMEKIWHLPGGVYNFGSENNESTYEVARRILRLWNADEKYLEKDLFKKSRNLRMDFTKIKKENIIFHSTKDMLDMLYGSDI